MGYIKSKTRNHLFRW